MASDWWRHAVIYQIYPRSFQDDNGDGIGDLAGITRRLDYVASLGVDAIWLSPFFTSPMADMGYDVADYRGVDPIFGTLADFDALMEKAHALGLKVIIDLVLSHSSDQHPWFDESRRSRDNPKADWYVWADPQDDGTPPNNWQSVFGGASWEWEPRRKQYYMHNFLIAQPDLNFHNPDVQDALLDVCRFWLERGVDGFRLDTVNYYFHDAQLRSNPPAADAIRLEANSAYNMQDHRFDKTQPENIAFLERLRALADSYPDRALVGEVGELADDSVAIMADYTRGEDRLHMAYSFSMLGPNYTAAHIRQTVDGFFSAGGGWPSWSFSNHDVDRHLSRWAEPGDDTDTIARQAISLLTHLPGTLGIYQGEELGQTNTDLEFHELTDPAGIRFWPETKGRDGCRSPMVWHSDEPNAGFGSAMPWLPVKAPQAARAVAQQEGRNDSVLASYRSALAFLKERPELNGADYHFLDLPEPVLGIVRSAGEAALTGVFNLSGTPLSLSLDAPARPVGPGSADIDGTAITLPAYGFVSLEGAPEVTVD